MISPVKIPDEADVKITILKHPVSNPYLCEFTVNNPDRQDMDSRAFDQQRPVRFALTECKVVGFIRPADKNSRLHGKSESIFLTPGLLPHKSRRSITFITEGEPKIELAEAHLANVVIGQSSGGWLIKLRRSFWPADRKIYKVMVNSMWPVYEQASPKRLS